MVKLGFCQLAPCQTREVTYAGVLNDIFTRLNTNTSAAIILEDMAR